jgi:U4/U6.U5 tri-snRNP-associated protein 1
LWLGRRYFPSAEPEGEGVEIDMDRYGDIEDEEELAARIKRDAL